MKAIQNLELLKKYLMIEFFILCILMSGNNIVKSEIKWLQHLDDAFFLLFLMSMIIIVAYYKNKIKKNRVEQVKSEYYQVLFYLLFFPIISSVVFLALKLLLR